MNWKLGFMGLYRDPSTEIIPALGPNLKSLNITYLGLFGSLGELHCRAACCCCSYFQGSDERLIRGPSTPKLQTNPKP